MLTLYRNKPLCQYGIKTQHPNYPTGNHNWICIIVRMFTTLPVFYKIKMTLTTSIFPQWGKIKVDVPITDCLWDALLVIQSYLETTYSEWKKFFSHYIELHKDRVCEKQCAVLVQHHILSTFKKGSHERYKNLRDVYSR